MLINKIFKIVILCFLLLWLVFFLLQKIDLTTADLGRFIKNGESIFKGDFDVLKTNFYSYSYPDYPFINHHWLTGAIFYVFWAIGGFSLLHLFFIVLSLITFLIFFRIAERESNFTTAVVLSLIIIPLIGYRREIRPEIFSYLFSGIFFLTLWRHKKGLISSAWLFILPAVEILWVNVHIYFFLGPLILGAFLLEKIIVSLKSKIFKIKNLLYPFFLCLVVMLVNPFGIKGAIHPFKIYNNYGYRVFEEQSVWFIQKLGLANSSFLIFKIIFLLLVISFVLVLIKNKKKISLVNLFLITGFSIMALVSIRNFTIFALFSLPVLAYNIKLINIKLNKEAKEAIVVILVLIALVFGIVNNYSRLDFRFKGFGLMPLNNQSAEFFKENNIQGPIFNNYDIGGYLIYNLFPEERVFTDNRPEVYPLGFFKDTYIPMQENNNDWDKQNEIYNFNVIFFSHRDYTSWGQAFLIERVSDDSWVPVFVDSYAIIFLKRNSLNKEIIDKYEIPKENFGIK